MNVMFSMTRKGMRILHIITTLLNLNLERRFNIYRPYFSSHMMWPLHTFFNKNHTFVSEPWMILNSKPIFSTFPPTPISNYMLKMLLSIHSFIWIWLFLQKMRFSSFFTQKNAKFEPRDSYKKNSYKEKSV